MKFVSILVTLVHFSPCVVESFRPLTLPVSSSVRTRNTFSLNQQHREPTKTARIALNAVGDDDDDDETTTTVKQTKKKVIVLGGDGFCGWPTSLHLSDQGHEVIIVDNLSRRYIDIELGCDSLTPIQSPEVRCQAWKEVSGKEIRFVNLDVAKEYDLLVQLIEQEQPDSIVHFAEQRAAPYSMKTSKTKRYTIDNNVGGSNNLCCAVIDAGVDAHIVHLGTMGVYGYGTSGGEIPEGYIDVVLPGGRESNILHPAYPGSVYHATKCLDALLWQFYQKNDQLRITDLHQGIVWGTNTPQTALDERLINRFDYDGDYGTVLNRFLMQGAMGVPLTVYGTGGQTRAFIHISDTARCIELAINNPPKSGDRVEIFNQVAETRRVRDIATLVASMTGVEVNFIPNPRQEAAENDLDVSNRKFCNLGLDPITLDTGLFDEVTEVVKKYKSRCNPTKILPVSFWNKKRAAECATLDPTSIKIKVDEDEVNGISSTTSHIDHSAAASSAAATVTEGEAAKAKA